MIYKIQHTRRRIRSNCFVVSSLQVLSYCYSDLCLLFELSQSFCACRLRSLFPCSQANSREKLNPSKRFFYCLHKLWKWRKLMLFFDYVVCFWQFCFVIRSFFILHSRWSQFLQIHILDCNFSTADIEYELFIWTSFECYRNWTIISRKRSFICLRNSLVFNYPLHWIWFNRVIWSVHLTHDWLITVSLLWTHGFRSTVDPFFLFPWADAAVSL